MVSVPSLVTKVTSEKVGLPSESFTRAETDLLQPSLSHRLTRVLLFWLKGEVDIAQLKVTSVQVEVSERLKQCQCVPLVYVGTVNAGDKLDYVMKLPTFSICPLPVRSRFFETVSLQPMQVS